MLFLVGRLSFFSLTHAILHTLYGMALKHDCLFFKCFAALFTNIMIHKSCAL